LALADEGIELGSVMVGGKTMKRLGIVGTTRRTVLAGIAAALAPKPLVAQSRGPTT